MFLAILGGAIGLPAVIMVSYLWRAYVLTILWAWFVTPIFHLPHLGLVPAIGVVLVASFLAYGYHASPKDERSFGEQMAAAIGYAALSPALYLLFGWIAHMFMGVG